MPNFQFANADAIFSTINFSFENRNILFPRFSWPNNSNKIVSLILDEYFMVNCSFDFDSELCKIGILVSSFGAPTKREFLKLF